MHGYVGRGWVIICADNAVLGAEFAGCCAQLVLSYFAGVYASGTRRVAADEWLSFLLTFNAKLVCHCIIRNAGILLDSSCRICSQYL